MHPQRALVLKTIIKIQNMDKGRGGGGQPMWIIFRFHNIINWIRGGEDGYPQNVDK